MTDPEPAKQTIADLLDVLRSAGGLRFEYSIETADNTVGGRTPSISVTLSGPDTPLLLERNGELLHAIESLGAAVLRLAPEEQDQLSLDADGFKAARTLAVQQAADKAIDTVRSTGQPFVFAPMNSRERRMLHLALSTSGLATASSGLGPRRFVVLYPEGQTPTPERFDQPARGFGGFDSSPRRTGPPQAWRRGAGREARPARSPSRSEGETPLSLRPTPAFPATDEALGNRKSPSAQSADQGEDAAATEARLESIRRAFRKR